MVTEIFLLLEKYISNHSLCHLCIPKSACDLCQEQQTPHNLTSELLIVEFLTHFISAY